MEIKTQLMPSNLRQNPFTRVFSWQSITAESHNIAEYNHFLYFAIILLSRL